MRAALALAARGLGHVWPNPTVGCVLVASNGRVAGRGWTQAGGRPHAETEALARAGAAARGATAYVTLEPCAHHGKTPPCAEALIAAGIARAVVAVQDPDPRVSGRGIAQLKEAGIAVEVGLLEREAAALNAGFFTRIELGRPLVALKLASTLDGRIATATGESRWITGPEARAQAHRLRAEHDALLVGGATVIADDPDLTCRLPGLASRSPVRVVLVGSGAVPPTAKLVATARRHPTWFLCVAGEGALLAVLVGEGVEAVEVEAGADGRPDIKAAVMALGRRGITRLLVEGGGRLAATLLDADLVDRLYWFHAPGVIGGDGIPAIGKLGARELAALPRFERTGLQPAGDDIMETYRRRA